VTWIYRQLFHELLPDGADTDTLLTRVVTPLIDDLERRSAIDRFFFLRYAENGNHLRLRVRVPADVDPRPSAAQIERAASGSPLVTRIVAAEYEPEVEKHGGAAGMEIAERQFCASSRFALRCLARTSDRPATRVLVAAWALDAMLIAADMTGAARHAFLAGYARYWREYARKMSVDVPASAPDSDSVALVQEILRDPDRVRACVGDESAYADAVARDVRELKTVARDGKLEAPLPIVLCNLAHTFHNRLGLPLAAEAWVADLLAAATAFSSPSPASGVAASVATLIAAARDGRPACAVIDGSDRALAASLSTEAARAGVRVLAAGPIDRHTAAPFALIHAIADVHPSGAVLRASLRRIQEAHDDPDCPLPPEPTAIADALRSFIHAETRQPTILILHRADAGDADTLDAILFLARALEDEPVGVALAVDGPPRPEWTAFLQALADGPGLVHVAESDLASGASRPPPTIADEAHPNASVEAARGMAFVRAGALREGVAILGRALASTLLPASTRADALIALAQALLRSSRPALARRAIDAATSLGVRPSRQVLARRVRMAALHNLGDTRGLDALHDEVIADAARQADATDGVGDAGRTWALLDAALVCATADRHVEHAARLDSLLARPDAAIPPQCLLAAHAWRSAAHLLAGSADRAIGHQRIAVATAERLGDVHRALFLRARLAASLAAHEMCDEAERLFDVTARVASWAGLWDLGALAAQHAISLNLARGEDAAAKRWLLAPRPALAPLWTSAYGALAALYLRAEMALQAGDAASARTHIDALRTRLAGLRSDRPENATLLEALLVRLDADAASARGDESAVAVAQEHAVSVEARLQPAERRLLAALVRVRCDGRLAQQEGRRR